ncbi:hypothetical protein PG984_011885 [Apiospora sp. TS-2023a]
MLVRLKTGSSVNFVFCLGLPLNIPETQPSGGLAPGLQFNPLYYSKEDRPEAYKHFSTFFDATEKLNGVIDKICEATTIDVHDAITEELVELTKALSAAKEAHQSLTQLSLHQTKNDSDPATAAFPEAEVNSLLKGFHAQVDDLHKGFQAELKAIMVNSIAPGLESVPHKAATASSGTTTGTASNVKVEEGPAVLSEPAPTTESRASFDQRGKKEEAMVEHATLRSRLIASVPEQRLVPEYSYLLNPKTARGYLLTIVQALPYTKGTINVEDVVPRDRPFRLNGKPCILRCPGHLVVSGHCGVINSISTSIKFMQDLRSKGESKAYGRMFNKADTMEHLVCEVLNADKEWVKKKCYGKEDFTTFKPFGARRS